MEASQWFTAHWFELTETLSVVGSLLFTAHAFEKDKKSRTISNLVALKQQYGHIWQEMYEQPELARVLEEEVDLAAQPVSTQERLFVQMLVMHLDTVWRAMAADMFVKLQGLQKDVRELFALPIPKAVWEKMKPFQDDEFSAFVDSCLNSLLT